MGFSGDRSELGSPPIQLAVKFLFDFNKLACFASFPQKHYGNWMLSLNPDFYPEPGKTVGFYHGVIVLLNTPQLQSISMHIAVCKDFISIKYSTCTKNSFYKFRY